MGFSATRVSVLLAALSFLGNALGAGAGHDQDLNDSGFTCAEIVLLGQDRFFKEYERKHPQTNARKVYAIYNECKHDDNTRRIGALPAAKRNTVIKLREALAKWHGAGIRMCWVVNGGGTIFVDYQYAAEADREDLIGRVITASQTNTNRRAMQATAVSRIFAGEGRAIQRLQRLRKENEIDIGDDRIRKEFDSELIVWKQETQRLKAMIRIIPKPAAQFIGVYIRKVIKNVQEGYE